MTRAERIDALFSVLEEPGMPGAAVAVLMDGEVVHRRGYGLADLETGARFEPGLQFAIASTTKQFTTACVLLLEEEGRLSLSDDYREYLPEMPDFGTTITLDHLCRMTSGIRDIYPLVSLAGGTWTDPQPRELTHSLLSGQHTLQFTPGSQTRYSNPNFTMLGWIIELVSGQLLGEFMKDRIFEPLGMHRTELPERFTLSRDGEVAGYTGDREKGFKRTSWEYSGEGSGGIWSTLDDLILWEKNFENSVIGSTGLMRRLSTPASLSAGAISQYCLGMMVGSHRGVAWEGHGGGMDGFYNDQVRFPDKRLSVIVLTNNTVINPYLGKLDVANVFLDEDPTVEPAPEVDKASAETVEPWLGFYQDTTTGVGFEVADKAGFAVLDMFGSAVELEIESPSSLVAGRGLGQMRVELGTAEPLPRVTIQLRPNPQIALTRAPEPTGDHEEFVGSFRNDELRAIHTFALDGEQLTVTRDGPLGSRGPTPLTQKGPGSYTGSYSGEEAALYTEEEVQYWFARNSGGQATEVVASMDRGEGVRFRRVE